MTIKAQTERSYSGFIETKHPLNCGARLGAAVSALRDVDLAAYAGCDVGLTVERQNAAWNRETGAWEAERTTWQLSAGEARQLAEQLLAALERCS